VKLSGLLQAIIVTGFVALAGGFWVAQSWLQLSAEADIAQTLRGVLVGTDESVKTWSRDLKSEAKRIAKAPEVVQITQSLLQQKHTREALLTNPLQDELRSFFDGGLSDREFKGYVILDQDHHVIAGYTPTYVGQTILHTESGELYGGLFDGQSEFFDPVYLNLSLAGKGRPKQKQLSMILGTPIRDQSGKVIAALVFRIDPETTFVGLVERGQFGLSGGTYAFDVNGTLISDSRFADNLRDKQLPISEAMKEAIENHSLKVSSNLEGYMDYRDVEVVGAWKWNKDLGLGLVTEQSRDEAFRVVNRARFYLGIFAAASAFMLMGLAFTFYGYRTTTDRNEVQLRAAEENARALLAEAERASQHKSEFLTNMSHEIRTPMTGIMGMLDLLTSVEEESERERLVRIAKNSGEGLLAIINDILDISRLEEGIIDLDLSSFNLRQSVQETFQLMEPHAETRNNTMVCTFECDEEIWVEADEGRVRQILFNLLGNAIKFTDGGNIGVHLEVFEPKDGYQTIRLSVEDSGIGIAPDDILHLFERFERVDSSLSRTREGAGLGLTICNQFITFMGGKILVESELGAGSKFTVELPLRVAAPKNLAPRVANEEIDPIGALVGKNILVAEDNKTNILVLRAFMKKAGCAATFVENGAEALEAIADVEAGRVSAFDVILMDIQMPVMDGVAATKAIRSGDGRFAKIPIVALTAHAMDGHRQEYLNAGMSGYAKKPIEFPTLVAEICRVLENPGDELTDMAHVL
jgi:signal transduction histidine kinase/CheY-like chemotaxis protein